MVERLEVYICGEQFVLRGVNHHRYNATALSCFFNSCVGQMSYSQDVFNSWTGHR